MGTFSDNRCQVCLEGVDTNDVLNRREKSANLQKSSTYLWNYLYHKNVREAFTSRNASGEDMACTPKFTFSLSAGTQIKNELFSDPIICETCLEELEMLDQLHKQLENVKNKIECQVEKIRNRMSDKRQDNTLLPKCATQNLQMSMGGSVLGKENIAQALKFLGNLCGGLSYSPISEVESPSSSLPPKDPLYTNTEEEQDFEIHNSSATRIHEMTEYANLEPGCVMEVEAEDIKVNTALYEYESILPDQEPSGSSADISVPIHFSSTHNQTKLSNTGSDKLGKSNVGPAKKVRWKATKGSLTYDRAPRQFHCEICDKTFKHRANLKRHRNEHSEKKPFPCDQCFMEFTRSDHLKSHKKNIHEWKPKSGK